MRGPPEAILVANFSLPKSDGPISGFAKNGDAIAVLQSFLKRIKRDAQGMPAKLYLFTRRGEIGEPLAVVVDPTVSFGRPVLEGTGIPTAILAERFKAGDSPEVLADDYGRPKEEIEEAIRYELKAA